MKQGIHLLKKAIRDHFGNNYSAVAKEVGRTPQAVSEIIRKGKRVPAEWCIPIERATDGKVRRHDLRPDLYPLAEAS